MKTLQNDPYSYRVFWSQENGKYVGLCAEFPNLSWLASAPEGALRGIRRIVSDSIYDMKKNKEPIPEPLVTKKYSGKLLVRIPPEVHKKLSIEAAEAGVSLNRLVSAKLSANSH